MTGLRHTVDRWGDLVLAVLVAAALAVEAAGYAPDRPAAVVVAAATGLTLVARRRLPALIALLVTAGVAVVDAIAPKYLDTALAVLVAILLALYSVGRHARGLEAGVGPVAVLAAVVVLEVGDGDGSAAGVFFYLTVSALPWAAGLAVRLGIDRVRVQRERNAALEEDARRAVARERARLARELHEVVAHAIAVTVLQARGAHRLVGSDDDAVRRALTAIETTNTAALADMRRLLALLRDADSPASALEPPPTLERLDGLLEQVRAAGVPVSLRADGDRIPVTPGLELSAFRIVQEALTNVVKHGGAGATASVHVRFAAHELHVTVDNTGGTVGGASANGGGHGLDGIRERATVAGGTLAAGPGGAGWRVHATLPYAPRDVVTVAPR